jgi:acyl-coenzyme A thioesterase PaaI-like protein
VNDDKTLQFADAPDDAPEGFRKISYGDPETFAGPFFERDDGTRYLVGFRVKQRHANLAGACHGGILATFCDLQARPVKRRLGLTGFSPTINLAIDYVEGARVGDWVWAEPQLVKRTGRMIFTQALIMVQERVILRTNATYRLFSNVTDAKEPGPA